MPDEKRELEDIRVEMREIDAQILALVHRRAKAARRAGEFRRDEPPLLSVRDRGAVRELVAHSSGEMSDDAVREIFEAIFAACARLEMPVRVAFAGPEGGAAHAAARGRFGLSSPFVSCDSSAAAFEEVSRKRAELAIAPFETSAGGPVETTIEALLSSDLRVVEVLDAPLDMHLMTPTGRLADVETVYVTAIDRGLCARALSELDDKVVPVDVATPAVACQRAAEEPAAAAVGLEVFGLQAGLQIARRNVLDDVGARVRFAIIGSRPAGRALAELTSFVFRLQQGSDALVDMLRMLADRSVRLTRIHSLPFPGEPWTYVFLAEAAGHFTDRRLVMLFEELKRVTRFFRLLGSYPDPGEERAAS